MNCLTLVFKFYNVGNISIFVYRFFSCMCRDFFSFLAFICTLCFWSSGPQHWTRAWNRQSVRAFQRAVYFLSRFRWVIPNLVKLNLSWEISASGRSNLAHENLSLLWDVMSSRTYKVGRKPMCRDIVRHVRRQWWSIVNLIDIIWSED